jgi:hypothetical protein
MLKSILTAGAIVFLGVATANAQTTGTKGTTGTTGAQQMTQAECQSIWSKADASTTGSLTQSQAQAYVSNFDSADTNNDDKLSSAEFLAACQKGMVKDTATTGTGSGTTGSTGSSSSPAVKK